MYLELHQERGGRVDQQGGKTGGKGKRADFDHAIIDGGEIFPQEESPEVINWKGGPKRKP